jgi:calcineurin-like phosphoesterase family protein
MNNKFTFLNNTSNISFSEILKQDPYITSDYHLLKWGRKDYPSEKIKNGEKHDVEVIELHNKIVKKDDYVIFLGDLGHKLMDIENINKLKTIYNNLNGKKILIKGNHDLKYNIKLLKDFGFINIYDGLVRCDNEVFTHEPIKTNNKELNFHGHIHESPIIFGMNNGNHINVFWKLWNGPVKYLKLKECFYNKDLPYKTIYLNQKENYNNVDEDIIGYYNKIKDYDYKIYSTNITVNEFEKLKSGTCIDFTNAIFQTLKEYQPRCFSIVFKDDKGMKWKCHTWPAFRLPDESFLVMECAYKAHIGLTKYETLEEMFKTYIEWMEKDQVSKDVKLFRVIEYIPDNYKHIGWLDDLQANIDDPNKQSKQQGRLVYTV